MRYLALLPLLAMLALAACEQRPKPKAGEATQAATEAVGGRTDGFLQVPLRHCPTRGGRSV